MNKIVKVLSVLTALLLTVVLAAVVFVVTLDPNEHKDWIAERFQQSTGRSLSLAGDVQLSVYPWLGVDAEDVTVGNEGFGEDPLFHADSMQLRVRLMPMLQGQYEIDTVRLYGADINLVVNEAGVGNWEDLTASEGDAAAQDEASQPFANVVLGGVDVRDASLSFDDRSRGVRYDLSDFDMSTGALAFGDPIDLTLSFNGAASQPELAAAVALTGTLAYDSGGSRYDISPLNLDATLSGPNVPDGSAELALDAAMSLDLEADTLQVSSLELAALDSVLRATVEGSGIQSERPVYQAQVNLSGEDMAVLFRVLEREELAARISALDSPSFMLDLALASDLGRGGLQVTELEGSVLGAEISGNLQASNLQSDTPRLQGRLNAAGPDLPTLIEVAGQFQGGSASPLSEYGRQLARVPDKRFSVDTEFDADLERGEVRVPTLDLQLLGAAITGELTASRLQSDVPLLRGRLNASGPDLPLLMQIAGQLQGGTEAPLNQAGRRLREGVANRAFNVEARFDADLEQGDIEVPVLNARMLGFQLNGNLTTSGMQGSGGSVQGALSLSGSNLREVLAALEQPDLAEVMQSVNLEMEVGGSRDNLQLNPFGLNLVLAGPRIPNSPVTVTLDADSRLNLDEERLLLDSFSLRGLGLDTRGSLTVSGFETPRVEGQVNMAPFNLRRLLEQLNQEVPRTADAAVLQRVALQTAFAGSAGGFDLDDLNLTLDDSTLQGSLTLSELDAPGPALAFALEIDSLDADRYLPPPAAAEAEDEAAAGAEIPADLLRELRLDGRLNVGNLTLSNLQFANLAVAMRAENGVVTVTPSTDLYQGSYSGDIGLDVSGETPQLRFASTLSGVEVGALLQDFMQASQISGTGNIELSLAASGADTAALKNSVDGNGRIELVDGVLQGVDVGAVLRQLETMIRNRSVQPVNRGQQTAFESFSATLLIDDGRVTSDNLLVEAEGFSVSGRGTLVDLRTDSIDYRMTATVTQEPGVDGQQYDIGGSSLPIACTGTISSPRCLPDTEEILRTALSRAVQRGVTNLLERALGVEGQQGGQQPQQPQPQQPQQQQPQQPQQQPQQEQQQEEPQDPAAELLNRALENLLR